MGKRFYCEHQVCVKRNHQSYKDKTDLNRHHKADHPGCDGDCKIKEGHKSRDSSIKSKCKFCLKVLKNEKALQTHVRQDCKGSVPTKTPELENDDKECTISFDYDKMLQLIKN